MRIIKNNQKGFAAFYITVLILVVFFTLAFSISILTYGQQRISINITKAAQAYYAAESGMEDAILRLANNPLWSKDSDTSYGFKTGDASTTVILTKIVGGSRNITSSGSISNRTRKTQAVYGISTNNISFFYGAQVGEGGLILANTSSVQGNVFSNGSITASLNQITGTVKVAKSGNKIEDVTILQDAYVDICKGSVISGVLTCATNDLSDPCTAASIIPLTSEIATASLPVLQTDIDGWKDTADDGGIISGDYTLDGVTTSIGPKKIEGNLIIKNSARISITGTLWVTGNITIQNTAEVKLDSAAYGSLSGVIISDGLITLKNSSKSSGSGQAGSYLMYLSTAVLNPAIVISNTAQADILFTSNGWIEIQNSVKLREITGYGIHIKNSAQIIYESGLQDASFTSGPGGDWEIASWREIE